MKSWIKFGKIHEMLLNLYDRPTLFFPGMKHAYLLELYFLGLNPPQYKRAEIMQGKTKVGRS